MKKILELYFIFFKLGLVNFGGGYAMLPLLERELVEKRGWTTEEDLADYYAIGQCTPGAIAINVSTFIGYKIKGVLGGIAATFGFISPAFFIILIIATILNKFAEYEVVQHAFAGIRVAVFVLVLSAILKLAKKSIIDIITFIIAISVALLSIFTDIPLFVYVILSGLIGIFFWWSRDLKVKKKDDKKDGEE
ncbi:MAG: chromate transporter [Anaeroplasma sp.]